MGVCLLGKSRREPRGIIIVMWVKIYKIEIMIGFCTKGIIIAIG